MGRVGMNDVASLFRRITVGVYVVGSAHNEQRDAFTAAWVMQVSYIPLLVALGINPEHASYPLLRESGAFTVNVLMEGQLELARRFGTRSGRDVDKLVGVRWHSARSGAPVLDEALAYFDCVAIAFHAAGDHELVIGRVVDGRVLDPDAKPMMYAHTGDMDGSSALYPEQL